jgi:hypothetical protein
LKGESRSGNPRYSMSGPARRLWQSQGGKFCIVVYFRGASRGGRELDGIYGEDTPAPSGSIDKMPGGISGPGTQLMS